VDEGAKANWRGLEDTELPFVEKNFDRTASLFSRHANDSNSSSFYNPSALPSGPDLTTADEGKVNRVASSDELYMGPIKEEGELLEELHDPIRGGRGTRNQRQLQRTEDHRMLRGSIAGTAASTSNRLNRFIARDDTPSRLDRGSQESSTGALEVADLVGAAECSFNREFKSKDNVDEINLALDDAARSRAQIRDNRRQQLRAHRCKLEPRNDVENEDTDAGDDDSDSPNDDADWAVNRKNVVDAKAEQLTDPPRKARDIMDEEFRASAIEPKQPMDELDRRPADSKQTHPDDGLNESISDEDIDFKVCTHYCAYKPNYAALRTG